MTSWPLCARYHALVVPMTPAPRTITLMPASDKKAKGGKLALYPPSPCPQSCELQLSDYEPILRHRFARCSGVVTERSCGGNESTLLTFARQATTASLFPRVRNHFLPLLTKPLDAKSDHVTGLQPRLGRLHTQRHPSRCSGGNDVTREQRHVVAHVRDKLATGKNHVLGIGGLPTFAV